MDLDHGFIPRINQANYRALGRAMAPRSLFDPVGLRLPWVWLDGTWAGRCPEFRQELRRHGVRYVVDTEAWRYQSETAFQTRARARLPHAPVDRWDRREDADFLSFVEADLRFQAKLGASAYLVPGLVPASRDDVGIGRLDQAIAAIATRVAFEHPRPLVAVVGVHSQHLDEARARITNVPHVYNALRVQVTPIDPYRDSADKLTRIVEFLLQLKDDGRTVIAGHMGALTVLLRALGLPGADAGLASDESFKLRDRLAPRRRADDGHAQGGGATGKRRYVVQLGRSFGTEVVERLERTPPAQALTNCDTCCRFLAPDDRLARGREHSLISRIAEAMEVTALPATMRMNHAEQRWSRAWHCLAAVNRALQDAGEPAIKSEYLDNQRAMFRTVAARARAA